MFFLFSTSISYKNSNLFLLCSRVKVSWLDMTYLFSNETFCWPGMTPFNMTQVYFPNVTRDGFYAIMYDFHTSDLCGTHIEAPTSLYKDKRSTGESPLDDLIGLSVLIDIRQKTSSNSDYQLMPSDIGDWEEKHGSSKTSNGW